MLRLAWSTDPHLNFVEPNVRDEFADRLIDASADAILLGGDIAEADSVVEHLSWLDDQLDIPIYFVLGNHDYYYGSLAQVRAEVGELCDQRSELIYLTEGRVIELTSKIALVGHDGWADGRIGDFERSLVMMNDYRLIDDLAGLDKRQRWKRLKELGDQAAADSREMLRRVCDTYEHVLFLTHVPPMREACWYNGQVSDDEWAPHFTCKVLGDVLLEMGRAYDECQLTVLCGHTHSGGIARPLDNLTIYTGGAEYGFPTVNHVFRFFDDGTYE